MLSEGFSNHLPHRNRASVFVHPTHLSSETIQRLRPSKYPSGREREAKPVATSVGRLVTTPRIGLAGWVAIQQRAHRARVHPRLFHCGNPLHRLDHPSLRIYSPFPTANRYLRVGRGLIGQQGTGTSRLLTALGWEIRQKDLPHVPRMLRQLQTCIFQESPHLMASTSNLAPR